MNDDSRLRPHTAGFHCGEKLEEEDDQVGSVSFNCSLPNGKHLVFGCREPSCGVLLLEEPVARSGDRGNDDYDSGFDPNFFDEGYTLAGKTGFKVWAGSRLLVEALTWPQASFDCLQLTKWQKCLADGENTHVLELGSGVGVVGVCLAAAGAHVQLTDLPTLVNHAIKLNLNRNENANEHIDYKQQQQPEWLSPQGVRIGKGWASATALDWTRPLSEQLSDTQCSAIDVVIASDCVFLLSMLETLLQTVAAIFRASAARNPKFLMSFQRRDAVDGINSTSFTTVERVLDAVRSRDWTIECLAWCPVTVLNTAGKNDTKEVFLFEIAPERSLS